MVRIRASAILGHSPQGQTLPLYVECQGVVYQAKFASRRSGLSVRELAIEAIGTELTASMGLETGIPALIELPEIVANDLETRYGMGLTDRFGFGTILMPELSPFLPEDDIYVVPPDEAATLLALDSLLLNGDRTVRNPNLGWLDDRLFVFDFEHALTLRRDDFALRMQLHARAARLILAEHVLTGRVPLGWAVEPMANALYNGGVKKLSAMEPYLPESWRADGADLLGYAAFLSENPDGFMAHVFGREG